MSAADDTDEKKNTDKIFHGLPLKSNDLLRQL
jgi:hypothetical protein